ncbi:hypothetical protein B14911_25875 [Bacillus sp. NRRL B-14911]|uniref:Uncharacterized protein n=1 Tax=Bacillus infantis NRRL B-14911 TaxID=1367477 RepID=U5LBJ0_9BACI|nr:hypothetical protein N288_14315 [Bacillus infantis NRRL B-14911]EAR68152.1 hypothetical protein B14911_25875 [Bacillus sp. NRRL B-14911]
MFLCKNELETDSNQLVHKKLTYIIRINSPKSFSVLWTENITDSNIYTQD